MKALTIASLSWSIWEKLFKSRIFHIKENQWDKNLFYLNKEVCPDFFGSDRISTRASSIAPTDMFPSLFFSSLLTITPSSPLVRHMWMEWQMITGKLVDKLHFVPFALRAREHNWFPGSQFHSRDNGKRASLLSLIGGKFAGNTLRIVLSVKIHWMTELFPS